MLWRFLPEVGSVWAVSVAFLAAMYHEDNGDSRLLYPAILVLAVSVLVTLICNFSLIYVVIYTGKDFPVCDNDQCLK